MKTGPLRHILFNMQNTLNRMLTVKKHASATKAGGFECHIKKVIGNTKKL